jgi:hypothetical protein
VVTFFLILHGKLDMQPNRHRVLNDGFAVQIGFAIYLLLDEELGEEADLRRGNSRRGTVLPDEIGAGARSWRNCLDLF